MISENLARVRGRIKAAAERVGRDPSAIKLVVVTKEAEIDQIREVVAAGVTDIGENRIKDALSKRKSFGLQLLSWHMIGHLQSNKAKDAVKIFSIIHSVDSIKLAHILSKEGEKNNKIQDILIEVNTSGEKTKFGVKPDRVESFLRETRALKNINILGLMTMAPLVGNAEMARPYFRKLKELADAYQLKELSMGMTQDFEVAIEEGATMVRIGSAIFKSRK